MLEISIGELQHYGIVLRLICLGQPAVVAWDIFAVCTHVFRDKLRVLGISAGCFLRFAPTFLRAKRLKLVWDSYTVVRDIFAVKLVWDHHSSMGYCCG